MTELASRRDRVVKALSGGWVRLDQVAKETYLDYMDIRVEMSYLEQEGLIETKKIPAGIMARMIPES